MKSQEDVISRNEILINSLKAEALDLKPSLEESYARCENLVEDIDKLQNELVIRDGRLKVYHSKIEELKIMLGSVSSLNSLKDETIADLKQTLKELQPISSGFKGILYTQFTYSLFIQCKHLPNDYGLLTQWRD